MEEDPFLFGQTSEAKMGLKSTQKAVQSLHVSGRFTEWSQWAYRLDGSSGWSWVGRSRWFGGGEDFLDKVVLCQGTKISHPSRHFLSRWFSLETRLVGYVLVPRRVFFSIRRPEWSLAASRDYYQGWWRVTAITTENLDYSKSSRWPWCRIIRCLRKTLLNIQQGMPDPRVFFNSLLGSVECDSSLNHDYGNFDIPDNPPLWYERAHSLVRAGFGVSNVCWNDLKLS